MKTWIQSLSRKKLQPRRLTLDTVGPIDEIAHSLSGNYRFTRQTWQRYSVAQHCEQGSQLLRSAFAGAFLLHELSEVYLPDVAGPLKPFVFVEIPKEDHCAFTEWWSFRESDLVPWTVLEKQHTRTMLEALGLRSLEPLIYSPEVKAMDVAMLAAEKRDLCEAAPDDWGIEDVVPAPVRKIEAWEADVAEAAFLSRFRSIFG